MDRADMVRDVGARIDRMPFARWHVRLTAIIGSARFFDALDTTTLAFVLPVLVGLWGLTPTAAGLLISASYLGQLIGAVGGGLLAERIGRIPAIRICLAIMALASVACAFSPSYAVLFALRVVQGLGLGGEAPISPTYLNEVCPVRQRGQAIVAIQLIYGAGIVCTSFLALIVIPHFGWRALFVIGGLPITAALALHRLVPESPRWLAATGRLSEAEAVVAAIERRIGHAVIDAPDHDPAACEPEAPPARGPAASEPEAPPARVRLGALVAPALLRPTLSAWIVAFCAPLVSFSLLGWMPTIYQRAYHLPVEAALRYSAIGSGMSLVGALLAIIIIARAGAKASMAVGLAGVACATAFLAVSGPQLGPIPTVGVVAVLFALISLPMNGLYAYAPELYPTRIRAFGVGVASAWVRVAAILVPPVVGMLLQAGGVVAVFGFLSGVAAIGAIGIAWLGVATGPRARRRRA